MAAVAHLGPQRRKSVLAKRKAAISNAIANGGLLVEGRKLRLGLRLEIGEGPRALLLRERPLIGAYWSLLKLLRAS